MFYCYATPLFWHSNSANLFCLPLALMLCQYIPLGSKQTWLPINGATNLTFDIVKNAISDKDPLNSRELCNPFNLEFPCAGFFYFSIKRQGSKSRSNYVSSKLIKSMTFFDYMGELTYKLPFKLGHALESIPRLITWKVVHEKEKGEKAH